MEYWEQKYNDVLYSYKALKKDYEELKERYNKVSEKLSTAEFKLETELKPRIKAEERAYDNWVTSPNRGGGEE